MSEIGMNEGTGGAEGSAGEVERVDGPGAGWPTPPRLPRLAGAISLSGALTLMLLAGFAGGGGTAFELAAGVWRTIGWGRGAPLIGGPAGGAYIRPPLSRASCPCDPPEPDARWAPLIDVVESYPAHEIAVLAASGGTLDGGSFERLDYHLPPDRLYGIARDPASPLGYRFRAAGRAPVRSGASTIDLPRSARFLIVPDTAVAALLDPSTLATERRPLADGSHVTVASVRGGGILELAAHEGHVHIRARRPMTPGPVEPRRVRVLAARSMSQITGAEAPYPTHSQWDVYGTDLGSVFWHRDRLYMVFGDSFGAGSRYEGRNWRSNVMARLATPGPAPDVLRIESMISGGFGFAREVLPSQKVDGVEMTVLPTSGISTGDRMFLHYMSVRDWIVSGRWEVGHAGVAYSDDQGRTWLRPPSAVWPGGLGFEQAALVRHEGMVYSFGIPGGRYGPVRLRRVAEARILDSSAYEYWDGARWIASPERAVPIVEAPAGQLSVAWNPRYRMWMMLYLKPTVDAVVLRLARNLTGPWTEPQFVVRGRDEPGLYAPYIVPLPDTGEEVWFAMSKWWPYNVFLMKMTLGTPPDMVTLGTSEPPR